MGDSPEATHMYIHGNEQSRIIQDFRGEEPQFLGPYDRPQPYITGGDFERFVNGEVPQQFEHLIESYEANIPVAAEQLTTRLPGIP